MSIVGGLLPSPIKASSQGKGKIAKMRWKIANKKVQQQNLVVHKFHEKSKPGMWRRPSELGVVCRDNGDQEKRNKVFGLDAERYMKHQNLTTANEREFAQQLGHFHGSTQMNGQAPLKFDTEESLTNLKSKVRAAAYSSVKKAADLRALYRRHADGSREGDGMMGANELMTMLQKQVKGLVNEQAAARLIAKITRRQSDRISERMFVSFFKMPKYVVDQFPMHASYGQFPPMHESSDTDQNKRLERMKGGKRPQSAMAKLRAKIIAKAKGLDLAEYFRKFDADRSGTITTEEMRFVLHRMLPGQITDETICCLMAQADNDGSGEIDFCELADYLHGRREDLEKRSLVQEGVKFRVKATDATKDMSMDDLHAQMSRAKENHQIQTRRDEVNTRVKSKLEKGSHALRDYRPAVHTASFACLAGKSDNPNSAATGGRTDVAWRMLPLVHDVSGCVWSPQHKPLLSSKSEPLMRATGGPLLYPGPVEADILSGSWKPADECAREFGFEMDAIDWPQLSQIKRTMEAQVERTRAEVELAMAEFEEDFSMHTDSHRRQLDELRRDFKRQEDLYNQLHQYCEDRAKKDGGPKKYSMTHAPSLLPHHRSNAGGSIGSSLSGLSGHSHRRSSGAQLRSDGTVVRFSTKDLAAAQRKVGFNLSNATRCSTTSTLTRLADREKYMDARQFKQQLLLQFNLRLPPAEFAALFRHFDTDGNGQVNSARFVRDARAYEQMRGLASTQAT
jgi:Ca2+-binding EF-hand superfamily protein